MGWAFERIDGSTAVFETSSSVCAWSNPELTRIERTLKIIPTPRWMDYSLWIEDITALKVTVAGKGSTYGDGTIRKTYQIQE